MIRTVDFISDVRGSLQNSLSMVIISDFVIYKYHPDTLRRRHLGTGEQSINT